MATFCFDTTRSDGQVIPEVESGAYLRQMYHDLNELIMVVVPIHEGLALRFSRERATDT